MALKASQAEHVRQLPWKQETNHTNQPPIWVHFLPSRATRSLPDSTWIKEVPSKDAK